MTSVPDNNRAPAPHESGARPWQEMIRTGIVAVDGHPALPGNQPFRKIPVDRVRPSPTSPDRFLTPLSWMIWLPASRSTGCCSPSRSPVMMMANSSTS